MMFDPLNGVLLIPALAACLLAVLPGYRLTARLNMLAAFLTFATAVSLFVVEPAPGLYLLVDDLNKVFIVLTPSWPLAPAYSARVTSTTKSKLGG